MTLLKEVRAELRLHADESDALVLKRFFKTGPGDYGEGDRFLGVRVPDTRRVARRYRELPLRDVLKLLKSPFHEERFLALVMLVGRYRSGNDDEKRQVYQIYLKHADYINNWDLVDTSAEHIVGAYLYARSHEPLFNLARSDRLWERRISIIATFYFIRHGTFDTTLRIASMLLNDEEDLIHKAVGWMLREVGKRDRSREDDFLGKHYRLMPRTMLRYAIEQYPEKQRQRYLKGTATCRS